MAMRRASVRVRSSLAGDADLGHLGKKKEEGFTTEDTEYAEEGGELEWLGWS